MLAGYEFLSRAILVGGSVMSLIRILAASILGVQNQFLMLDLQML
jgi:hypothetical protein